VDVHHINPFIHSAINVFTTMLDCDIRRTGLRHKNVDSPSLEVSGVIGLSGKACGSVVFSLSREVALQAAERLLMEPFQSISDEVIDAVGEITNMVAGAAKKELSQYELYLGLPTVIIGRDHTIAFPKNVRPICVEFETPWGPAELDVGLQMESVGQTTDAKTESAAVPC